MRRSDTGFKDGYYGPIGGHLEGGETIQQAAIREWLHWGRALLKRELSTACIFYRDDRNEFACDRKGRIL